MNNSKLRNYRWQLCIVIALLNGNMFGNERNKFLYGSIAFAGALTAGAGCMDRYSSTPSKLALIGGGAAAMYGIYKLSRTIGGDDFSFAGAKRYFSNFLTFNFVQRRNQDQSSPQQAPRSPFPGEWRGLKICVCGGGFRVSGDKQNSEGNVNVVIKSIVTKNGKRYVNGIEACCTHCKI